MIARRMVSFVIVSFAGRARHRAHARIKLGPLGDDEKRANKVNRIAAHLAQGVNCTPAIVTLCKKLTAFALKLAAPPLTIAHKPLVLFTAKQLVLKRCS